ncbi:F-box/LRR-repeat protein 15 isoform 4-T5 [Liasis olivaceus]
MAPCIRAASVPRALLRVSRRHGIVSLLPLYFPISTDFPIDPVSAFCLTSFPQKAAVAAGGAGGRCGGWRPFRRGQGPGRSRKHFLDLPWEDILFPHVLSYLPLRQLLSLQRVSKAFRNLIQLYVTNMRHFDSSQGLRMADMTCPLNSLMRTLADYCPKLRALKVKHCHDVVESSLSILRSRGVELDVEPPLQRALVLLQDVVGFAPFINLQI